MGFGEENVLDFAQVALCAGANDTTSDKSFNFMVCQFHVNRGKINERLHEYKPSVQSNFSVGQKFVWYHV